MTEPAAGNVSDHVRFGLLMEGAQVHQRLAEEGLNRLREHTAGLDQVVRDAVRLATTEALREVHQEAEQAAVALRALARQASWRGLAWAVVAALTAVAVPLVAVMWLAPSPAEMARARTLRDDLARNVAGLEARGGRAAWTRCGDPPRLCVRIDRQAPKYGDHGEYAVVQER